jgi:LPXTG-motif cell wall-anchored protein
MRAKYLAIAVALLGISAIGAVAPAGATKPDPDGEHKVWVCHATSGQGELKNGYNLIYVDVASTVPNGAHGENDHYGHSTTDPKDNPTFGVLYDYLDVDPNNLPGKCGTQVPQEPSKDPVERLVGTVPNCETENVTLTYEVTTYSYTWDGTTWVETASTTTVERTRPMTGDEIDVCEVDVDPPPMPSKDPVERLVGTVPNCETENVTDTFEVTTYSYTWDGTTWVESESTTTKEVEREMTEQELAACPTQESQGPVPPATETPVPEVAPTAAGDAPTATPTALPATGSEHWAILVIGLTSLLAGTGLLRLSRRPA